MTGKVEQISRDFDGVTHLMLTLHGTEGINELFDLMHDSALCDIEIQKHREKRSLNANAYAWALMEKIATLIRSDKWSVYLEMLRSYGQFDVVTVAPEAVETFCSKWRECVKLGEVTVDGQTGVQIQAYYGSSTYNTAEMARFIDGIVSEARWLGIETMTPAEIERMKTAWGK